MAVSSINDMTDQNRDGNPDNIAVHMWVDLYMHVLQVGFGQGEQLKT